MNATSATPDDKQYKAPASPYNLFLVVASQLSSTLNRTSEITSNLRSKWDK